MHLARDYNLQKKLHIGLFIFLIQNLLINLFLCLDAHILDGRLFFYLLP